MPAHGLGDHAGSPALSWGRYRLVGPARSWATARNAAPKELSTKAEAVRMTDKGQK
jgi:hypothetical protein